MQLLREHKVQIVWCISLTLLLLPIAKSLACSSAHIVTSIILTDSASMKSLQPKYLPGQDSLIPTFILKSPSCHTTKGNSDNAYHEQLNTSESVCNGECCQYCMLTCITNTSSIVESRYDSFHFQVTIVQLKPDILSVPATPPPIV